MKRLAASATLLMLVLSLCANALTADSASLCETLSSNIVTIGDGNQNYHLPIDPRFSYNYTQSIFLQSEINPGGQSTPFLIESIAYYWNGAGGGDNSCGWNVYMGHTDRASFAGNTDWIPVGEMMQVFAGYLNIPAVPGWIEIELDTPFMYSNTGNLVIAVQEHTPRYDRGRRNFYSTYTPNQHRSLICYDYVYPEPDNPPFGVLINAIPNIQLSFGALPAEPILSITPQSLDFGLVFHEEPTTMQLMLSNAGTGSINLATAFISITGAHASEFSLDLSSLPANLEAGQCVFIPVTVTGLSAGELSTTLRITYDGVNHDLPLTAEVLPAETFTIGSGTTYQQHPFATSEPLVRTATLYTAAELGSVGILDLIGWDCARPSYVAVPYKIWVKNTTATVLSEVRWETFVYDMTLVKEGIFRPNTTGWHTFELDTAFAYEGENLIVAVETSCGGYGFGYVHDFWFTITAAPRFVYWYGTYSGGRLTDSVPNIMLHFNRSMANDLEAISLNGNLTPTVGNASNYIVRLRNNGSNTQSNYQVKLMSADNIELAAINGPPIHSGRTIEAVVSWTPTTVEPISIFAKVELADDEIASNDRTASLNLAVNPAETLALTIGYGDQDARIPIDLTYQKSLFQTLYFPEELGCYTGEITGVSFYTQFYSSVQNLPFRIWLGSTTQDDLSAGYIPASQLTVVFDGSFSFDSGENVVTIPFDQPYLHQGGNLVMMVYRSSTQRYDYLNYFKCQTLGTSRSRQTYTSSAQEQWDLDDPPDGFLSGQFPKTSFIIPPAELGYVTGTVMDSDGNPLSEVILTNGSVTTTTNSGGLYILGLPVGLHTITAKAADYANQSYYNVPVQLNQHSIINFILTYTPNDDPQTPALTTALNGNYPNPFNPQTTISYSLAQPGRVKLTIYNIKGQLVRTLVDEEQPAGHYKRIFAARDDQGRSLASGIYLIKMDAPGYRKTSKMMLMQ